MLRAVEEAKKKDLAVIRRIGIVGPDAKWWTKEEVEILQQVCEGILKGHSVKPWLIGDSRVAAVWIHSGVTMLVSGRCHKGGVDVVAENVADSLGCLKMIFTPTSYTWPAYRERNLKIARAMEIGYCIVPYRPNQWCRHHQQKGHPSNGGCFTILNVPDYKEVHLIVIRR